MEVGNQHPNPVTSQRCTTWRFPFMLVHLSSLDWPHQKFRSMLRSRGKWLGLTFQRNFFRDVFKSPLSLPDCPPFALSSSFLSAAGSRNVTSVPSFVSLLLDGSDVLHLHQYRVVHKIWVSVWALPGEYYLRAIALAHGEWVFSHSYTTFYPTSG